MAGIDDPDTRDEFDPRQTQVDQANLNEHLKTREQETRVFLENRINAYRRVFVAGTPSPEDRAMVLDDLNYFCRYNMSAFHNDTRIHCLLTGRQEVALRIHDHMTMNVDQMVQQVLAERK